MGTNTAVKEAISIILSQKCVQLNDLMQYQARVAGILGSVNDELALLEQEIYQLEEALNE